MYLNFLKYIVNLKTKSYRKKYIASLNNPQKAQKKVLKKILSLSGKTELPLKPSKYDDYSKNISWTLEKAQFFEPTSGSSGFRKEIPYTKSLLKSFENMFFLWADDTFKNHIFKRSKTFISISPKIQTKGTETDVDYLSSFSRFILKPFLVMPYHLQKAKDSEEFKLKLSIELLKHHDLEIISIWSPSYLISLLDWMVDNQEKLEASALSKRHIKERKFDLIWPNLKLISAWDESYSKYHADQLKIIFPKSSFQGKGLLCTEGPVTIPWGKEGVKLPLWTEVYLEFINSEGQIRPLYSIAKDEEGELLISTTGGLLRYSLGDKIRCNGFYMKSPSIEFCGRSGAFSDLVGEKLSESLVYEKLNPHINGDWALLPFMLKTDSGYCLITDGDCDKDIIEKTLKTNYHYNLARELGQLKKLSVKKVKSVQSIIEEHYVKKQSLGDQKKKYLINELDDSMKILQNLNY